MRFFPGFCDVYVRFREPGFFYKQTIATGSLAPARGECTAVRTMPDLHPVPDHVEHPKIQKGVWFDNMMRAALKKELLVL